MESRHLPCERESVDPRGDGEPSPGPPWLRTQSSDSSHSRVSIALLASVVSPRAVLSLMLTPELNFESAPTVLLVVTNKMANVFQYR